MGDPLGDLVPRFPPPRAQDVADALHARLARRFVIADVFFEASEVRAVEAGDGAAGPSVVRRRGLQLRGVGRDASGTAHTEGLGATEVARALDGLGLPHRAAPAWPRYRGGLAALDDAVACESVERLLAALRRGAAGAQAAATLSTRSAARAVFRRRGQGAAWREWGWVLRAEVALPDGVVAIGRWGRESAPPDALVDALAEAVLREREAALRSATRVGGSVPVVIAAGASGAALHELVGHSLEADNVLVGDSSLVAEERVAMEALSVVDDPTPLTEAGGIVIDDEGTPARAVSLLRAGRVVGVLHDRVSAALSDARGAGNGRRADHRGEPAPRMRNLVVSPGPDAPDALLSGIRDGLYVERLSGWNRAGRFGLAVHAGRRIRAGALAEPVRGALITGAVRDALAALEGVGCDAAFSAEPLLCEKRGALLTGVAGPTIRFARMEVS